MKFLLDENMLPSFREVLRDLVYVALHVYDVDLGNTSDEEIVFFARQSGDTIITNDLDFSRIISLSKAQFPSIITFRFGALKYEFFREIALLNFSNLKEALDVGSLITIDEGGIRIRKLPVY